MKCIKGMSRFTQKLMVAVMGLFSVGVSFAQSTNGHMTLNDLQTNVASTSDNILKVIMTVITIAGIILVIKGIVHLKQNYTGTGQEKHLSKGLASLGFGAALFIAVPITHMLVAGISGSPATYDNWNSTYQAQSLSS